jgi:hypothetical protein
VLWARFLFFACGLTRLLLLRAASALAFVVHLEDCRVVNESIDRRQGHCWVDENITPLRERRIRF